MQFLANENFPLESVRLLKEAGHQIEAVILQCPGISDDEVLLIARDENRIILTFDRGYGDLIYRKRLAKPSGLVCFRFDPIEPSEPAERLFAIMQISDLTLEGKFTIADRLRIRQRPLPK